MTGVQTCALPICFPVTIIKMDAMELAYRRAVDDMQSITDDEMKGMFDKLEELRLGLIKEDQSGAAHDIPVVEMDEASSSVIA